MKTVGSYEAKTRLPHLLEKVANGERITITKHGAPVAMLVPVDSRRAKDSKDVIRQIKEFRKGRTLKGVTIRQLIEEGRRY